MHLTLPDSSVHNDINNSEGVIYAYGGFTLQSLTATDFSR